MKFGINTFLFTSPFKNKSVSLFPDFKKWGFDSVELAIEDPSHITPRQVKKALDDNGLVCHSICAAMGPGRDYRGTAREQRAAHEYLKGVLDLMPELGCSVLAGPVYSSVGRANLESDAQRKVQWEKVVNNLSELGKYANDLGVTVAVEPLNRYETDFVNTCAQVKQLIDDVGSSALGIHLDTFHMNLEEKDPGQAIKDAGKNLKHFHACGTDRGTPGLDQVNWDNLFDSLISVGYTGSMVIESFSPKVKIIAKAASIWRPLATSAEVIAEDGLNFLKKKAAAKGMA